MLHAVAVDPPDKTAGKTVLQNLPSAVGGKNSDVAGADEPAAAATAPNE
jgi:hypothetical protein